MDKTVKAIHIIKKVQIFRNQKIYLSNKFLRKLFSRSSADSTFFFCGTCFIYVGANRTLNKRLTDL